MNSIKNSHDLIYKHVYRSEDIDPVYIKSVDMISEKEVEEFVKKYKSAGFVVFELLNDSTNQNVMLKIAKRFKLGEPFVPNIYLSKPEIYEKSGLNIIKAGEGTHRAFQTINEQKIHCDGTIEPIGKIKTSILLCITPAAVGGETIIFNSVAAFYDLYENKESNSIMSSFLHFKALKRVAVNGEKEEYIGPSFLINNGEISSRFSLDNTCDWDFGFRNVEFLKEAYSLMTEKITPNSPYYIETRLKKNQGIVMANDKISHGRKEYKDGNSKREMIRGLFEIKLAYSD
ncbi:TauD/TfdA family dioxygenase [Paenisporosarcina macmurdoensis]|uniref:TauD/TfdA family dioxygenase n=1 Tax=Paenisporosarcina macmurdoensis TaxID=212659 RepID=A0ABW1L5B9_9BACL